MLGTSQSAAKRARMLFIFIIAFNGWFVRKGPCVSTSRRGDSTHSGPALFNLAPVVRYTLEARRRDRIFLRATQVSSAPFSDQTRSRPQVDPLSSAQRSASRG